MKIHSSCEIEDFVETHICKLCVWYSDRAYYGLCVLIKDMGRRLPLQLQCSYQGQQGNVCQSVLRNHKTRFWGEQNLTTIYLVWKLKNTLVKQYVYVKYDHRFLWARCSPAAEGFFSYFRRRGKLTCHGYIMKHVWISAKLRGSARRIKRRSSGSIWQGIAFRVAETSRSRGTSQIVLQILIRSMLFINLYLCGTVVPSQVSFSDM